MATKKTAGKTAKSVKTTKVTNKAKAAKKPTPKKQTFAAAGGKAEERRKAMLAAGMDVNGYLSISSADKQFEVRLVGGKLQVVSKDKAQSKITENSGKKCKGKKKVDYVEAALSAEAFGVSQDFLDAIERGIIDDGYVKNNKLYRRWVTAQMFRMLNYNGHYGTGYTAALKMLGYEYSWRTAIERLRVLKELSHRDADTYNEGKRWFTAEVLAKMFEHHEQLEREYVEGLKIRHCHRREYKRIHGTDIFVNEIEERVFAPLVAAARACREAQTVDALYETVVKWNKKRNKLNWDHEKSAAFIDAYKGEGAYYTTKNLILFHNCKVVDEQTGEALDKYTSFNLLNAKADEYVGQGWKLFGFMKKIIKDNNFTPNW